ncbi:hypothetical protein BG015_007280, partial [Linnemannia schmuckeri]
MSTTNGNKDAMTPEKDKSTLQGQAQTQSNPIGTGTAEPQTGEQGKGIHQPFPSAPKSGTSAPETKPRVYLTGIEGLVWDIQGSLAGSLPRSPMQNIFQGLPLRLLPEEISVLLHHNIIDLIIDNHNHDHSHNQQQHHNADLDTSNRRCLHLTDHALVFEHLWKDHQFFIAPGMKFGGDYLLYRNDPLVCHASLVASVKEPEELLSLVDMANNARLVST